MLEGSPKPVILEMVQLSLHLSLCPELGASERERMMGRESGTSQPSHHPVRPPKGPSTPMATSQLGCSRPW